MQPAAFAIQLNAYAGHDASTPGRLLRVMTSKVFGAEGATEWQNGSGRSAWPNSFAQRKT